MKWLREKGFAVTPVYLKKEKTKYRELKHALMKGITKLEIMSNMDYDRQARELSEIIKKL